MSQKSFQTTSLCTKKSENSNFTDTEINIENEISDGDSIEESVINFESSHDAISLANLPSYSCNLRSSTVNESRVESLLSKKRHRKYAATPYHRKTGPKSSNLTISPSETCNLRNQDNYSSSHLSEIEKAFLNSSSPIKLNESSTRANVRQQGILVNRYLSDFNLNSDETDEIIIKKPKRKVNFVQEIAIRYLRPTTPPEPEPIIIEEEKCILTPPDPPVIIRQYPARSASPPSLIIREAPPPPPPIIPTKLIKISGKKMPPPPRKVIIERLPKLPTPPPTIIVERWLPYPKQKRNVIFTKETNSNAVRPRQKNVIIEWELPKVYVKKRYKYCGVTKMDPDAYSNMHKELIERKDLPDFAQDVDIPDAKDPTVGFNDNPMELEGDVDALDLIDLDKEGLSEYKNYASKHKTKLSEIEVLEENLENEINRAVHNIFLLIDPNNDGKIDITKASKILAKINKKLGMFAGKKFSKRFCETLLYKQMLKDE